MDERGQRASEQDRGADQALVSLAFKLGTTPELEFLIAYILRLRGKIAAKTPNIPGGAASHSVT